MPSNLHEKKAQPKVLLCILPISTQRHSKPAQKQDTQTKTKRALLMTKPAPDTTQTQTSIVELLDMLKQELVNCQDPKFTPHASREERSASRWLYEQIINYQGMLRKRPLTRPIEFITRAAGPGFSQAGTGWYYQPITLRANTGPSPINWIGPFASHHEAEQQRISHLPKTKTKLELALLLED
jgi:hypothetical protein